MGTENYSSGFVRHCHLHSEIIKPGYCRMVCEPSPELMNSAGYFHGGLIFSLIDSAAGRAACCLENGYRPVVTQNAAVYYLRPCRDSSLRAEAGCEHQGRTTAHVSVKVYDDRDRLVARGEVSCYYTGDISPDAPFRE